ncbi:MAG TPA: DUF116 domain-containing protein [Holophaga sp.]|nr:DUF116 domain-containing protein [Holophaga sp.]
MIPPLPPERTWPFLLVRRGLPLALAAAALVTATAFPGLRGWSLLAAVACLAEVGSTFRRGQGYMNHRMAITRLDALWARAFRPLSRFLGREEAWILAFCAWNNRRVREAFQARPAQRAIVLLPHCIQLARCKAEIIQDMGTCHQCGLCPVGDVLEETLQRRWEVRLSNRSRRAYREAREYGPDLMVAVACPDRLFKGLTRLPEIPGYTIPLALPHGMCVDTTFSVPHLVAAMEALVEPRTTRPENIQPLHAEGQAG